MLGFDSCSWFVKCLMILRLQFLDYLHSVYISNYFPWCLTWSDWSFSIVSITRREVGISATKKHSWFCFKVFSEMWLGGRWFLLNVPFHLNMVSAVVPANHRGKVLLRKFMLIMLKVICVIWTRFNPFFPNGCFVLHYILIES